MPAATRSVSASSANRRWSALLVLVLAVTGVLVTTAFNRVGVVGRATVSPPDPPPSPGECLTTPAPLFFTIGPDGTVEPDLLLGTCEQPHFGELVFFLDLAQAVVTPGSNECLFGTDPYKFLGFDVRATDTWVPTLAVAVVPVSPDPRQYAAGQRWVACAVAAREGSPPFVSALRDTFPDRSAPAAFGLCSNATEPINGSSVPCTERHVTELFATFRFDGLGPEPATLDRSCRDLINRQVGISDVGEGTDLEVQVPLYEVVAGDQVRTDGPAQATGRYLAVCQLSAGAGRGLSGSLRSLGAADLPWSP